MSIENINNGKKENIGVKPNKNSVMEMLLSEAGTEEIGEFEQFININIKMKVINIVEIENEDGVVNKLRFQHKSVNPDTGDMIEGSFSVRSEDYEKAIDKKLLELKGKTVLASGLTIYNQDVKDITGKVIKRNESYGLIYDGKNLKEIQEDVMFEINKYVEIELTSVANILKKKNGKSVKTQDVKLISITEKDGNLVSFECKLIGLGLDRKAYDKFLSKKVRISNIEVKYGVDGKPQYSTDTVFELV